MNVVRTWFSWVQGLLPSYRALLVSITWKEFITGRYYFSMNEKVSQPILKDALWYSFMRFIIVSTMEMCGWYCSLVFIVYSVWVNCTFRDILTVLNTMTGNCFLVPLLSVLMPFTPLLCFTVTNSTTPPLLSSLF